MFDIGDHTTRREIDYAAAPLLLTQLLNICGNLKGIVTEVAWDEHNMPLKRRFRRYATCVFKTGLYQININYVQPSLESLQPEAAVGQDLLYAPTAAEKTLIDMAGGQLTRAQALDILRFVYMHVYGDSYRDTADEETYFDHVQSLLSQIENELSDFVPLIRI